MKTLKVTPEVWKKLKIMAVEQDTTIGKLIEEMLSDYTK
jgi:predicted DNA-binding ribbon-helix-helix protein